MNKIKFILLRNFYFGGEELNTQVIIREYFKCIKKYDRDVQRLGWSSEVGARVKRVEDESFKTIWQFTWGI